MRIQSPFESPPHLVGEQQVAHRGVLGVLHDGRDDLQHGGDPYIPHNGTSNPLSHHILFILERRVDPIPVSEIPLTVPKLQC